MLKNGPLTYFNKSVFKRKPMPKLYFRYTFLNLAIKKDYERYLIRRDIFSVV